MLLSPLANPRHKAASITLAQATLTRTRTALSLAVQSRHEVFGVIGNLINETGCKALIVNGVEDHVHCFVGLRPVVAVSELMKTVKAKSSKYINDRGLTPHRFEWQEGYGAFTYSAREKDKIINYIKNQKDHHKKETFYDEFKRLLIENDVEFDEKYLL